MYGAARVESGDVEPLVAGQLEDLAGERGQGDREAQRRHRRRRGQGVRRHTLDPQLREGAPRRQLRLDEVELADGGIGEGQLGAGVGGMDEEGRERGLGEQELRARAHRRVTPSPGAPLRWMRPRAMLTPANGSSARSAAPSRSA